MQYFYTLLCLLPLFAVAQAADTLTGVKTEAFGVLGTEGQTFSLPDFEWKKIIINDFLYDSFQHEYLIERTTHSVTLLNDSDSVIKQLDEKMVNGIVSALKKELGKEFDPDVHNDPMMMFERDSAWYLDNASRLWESYKKNTGLSITCEEDTTALRIIKDYPLLKNILWHMQGTTRQDFYPMLDVLILSLSDTIHIQATGQHPYMLPWYNFSNGQYELNSGISVLVSALLPYERNTNKNRLTDTFFEYALMDEMYTTLLKGKIALQRK